MSLQLAEELRGGPATIDDRRIWGRWTGDPCGLFVEAGKLVKSLSWTQVLKLGGSELEAWCRRVRESFQRMHADHDGRDGVLQARLVQIVPSKNGKLHLFGYSPYDPLEVTPDDLAMLATLEGQRLSAILDGAVDSDRQQVVQVISRYLDHAIVDIRFAPPEAL